MYTDHNDPDLRSTGGPSASRDAWSRPRPSEATLIEGYDTGTLVISPEPPKKAEDSTPLVVVMGPTGTGKSSFIKRLTNSPDIVVGDTLKSETSGIVAVQYERAGLKLTLVDTPGFDGSELETSDADVLCRLSDFLMTCYNRKFVNAMIYVHRISDPRLGNTARRNFRMFKKICGDAAMNNVIILTTRWDEVPKRTAETREAELKADFGGAFGGAQFLRHYGTKGSAESVMDVVFKIPHVKTVQLAQQLVDKIPLCKTDAGAELYGQLEEAKRAVNKKIGRINDELVSADQREKEELHGEHEELRERASFYNSQQERLKLYKALSQVVATSAAGAAAGATTGVGIGLRAGPVGAAIGAFVGGLAGATVGGAVALRTFFAGTSTT